jgi:hypothetical protein
VRDLPADPTEKDHREKIPVGVSTSLSGLKEVMATAREELRTLREMKKETTRGEARRTDPHAKAMATSHLREKEIRTLKDQLAAAIVHAETTSVPATDHPEKLMAKSLLTETEIDRSTSQREARIARAETTSVLRTDPLVKATATNPPFQNHDQEAMNAGLLSLVENLAASEKKATTTAPFD